MLSLQQHIIFKQQVVVSGQGSIKNLSLECCHGILKTTSDFIVLSMLRTLFKVSDLLFNDIHSLKLTDHLDF